MPAPIVEYFRPGDLVTFTTGATAVEAGDVVELSGNMLVIPAAADSTKVVGVAAHDAAVGAIVSVFIGGMVLPMATPSATTITAGQKVVSAGGGQIKAAPAAGGTYALADTTIPLRVIGVALQDFAASTTGKVLLIH